MKITITSGKPTRKLIKNATNSNKKTPKKEEKIGTTFKFIGDFNDTIKSQSHSLTTFNIHNLSQFVIIYSHGVTTRYFPDY